MVVEFYFNSCPACNSNARNVESISEEFGDAVLVVDFGYDCSESAYRSWIANHNPALPNHPVVNGCDSPVFDDLNVQAFPTTLIVDKDKRIVKRYVGTWDAGDKAEIIATLRELQ